MERNQRTVVGEGSGLSFHVAGWYYPAFNVADIGITLGAIGLIWESLFAERRRARRRG